MAHYTKNDAQQWLDRCQGESPIANFAVARSEEAIGGIGVDLGQDIYRKTAEIGYWLGEPFWGQGIMTLAARAMVEYAFETFDLVRIDTVVLEWNPASARVLEKAGFVFEGRSPRAAFKDGKVIDHLRFAIVR